MGTRHLYWILTSPSFTVYYTRNSKQIKNMRKCKEDLSSKKQQSLPRRMCRRSSKSCTCPSSPENSEIKFSFHQHCVKEKKRFIHEKYHKQNCAADFSLLNLPKGKSLGRSKPATNS